MESSYWDLVESILGADMDDGQKLVEIRRLMEVAKEDAEKLDDVLLDDLFCEPCEDSGPPTPPVQRIYPPISLTDF